MKKELKELELSQISGGDAVVETKDGKWVIALGGEFDTKLEAFGFFSELRNGIPVIHNKKDKEDEK